MRALFGLMGLILTVAIVMILTARHSRTPVQVPAVAPGQTAVTVPMAQVPSQVQSSMDALTQQQAQQMQQQMQQLATPTVPAGER